MFEIVVSCSGISEQTARDSLDDLYQELAERPWYGSVTCHWEHDRVDVQARNDHDATGQALLDEFWDVVCACIPAEDSERRFVVESVTGVADAGWTVPAPMRNRACGSRVAKTAPPAYSAP
jgi:hypothetical protein